MAFMKQSDIRILTKIDESLIYLNEQEEKLKPCMDFLLDMMSKKVKTEEMSYDRALELFIQLHKQYTDSILLMAKLKEILDYKATKK